MQWSHVCVSVGLVFAGVIAASSAGDFPVFCYFTNWAQYRASPGTFRPSDIPATLCTHIMYAFAKINNASLLIETVEYNDDLMYTQVLALKKTNPALKVILAVGGAGRGSHGFKEAADTNVTRATFTSNAISFLRKNAFDGLDVDWEFPAPAEREKFTLFLSTLYTEMAAEATRTGKPRLLLTAAVAAYKDTVDTIYEPEKIHKYLDYVLVMAYDYNGPWSSVLGHNSPLYVPAQDRGTSLEKLSQDASMSHWLSVGTPTEKLVMGLGTYGRSFRMNSSALHNPGDLYNQGQTGDAFTWTAAPGDFAYYEMCQLLTSGFQYVYRNDSQVPTAYGLRNGHWEWMSYDDVTSMTAKSNYIVSRGLGGAMFWCLDKDDFRGSTCGQGRYPLITTVANILKTAIRTTTTTTATTPTTTAVPTTTAAVPTTTTAVPTTTTAVPTTTTVVPTTTTAVPTTTTAIPTTTTAVPTTTTAVPTTTTPKPVTTTTTKATSLPSTASQTAVADTTTTTTTPKTTTSQTAAQTSTMAALSSSTGSNSQASSTTTTTQATTTKQASRWERLEAAAGTVRSGALLVMVVSVCAVLTTMRY